jgi:hypothetical protein
VFAGSAFVVLLIVFGGKLIGFSEDAIIDIVQAVTALALGLFAGQSVSDTWGKGNPARFKQTEGETHGE